MNKWIAFICVGLFLASAGNVCAQDESGQMDEPEAYVEMFGSYGGKAELGDDQGEVSTTSGGIEAGYKWVSLSYETTSYNWDDENKLPFGNGSDDPWDRLTEVNLGLHNDWHLQGNWGMFAFGGINAAYEDEMDDSLGADLGVGLSYVINEEWMASFGVMGSYHKTGYGLMPMAGLMWNYAAEEGFFANLGMPETSFGYRVDPTLEFALSVGMDGGTYRLADDSSVEKEGYISTDAVVARLGVDWEPVENLSINAGPEYRFAHSMTLYNKDGESRNTYEVDGAFGFGLGVAYHF